MELTAMNVKTLLFGCLRNSEKVPEEFKDITKDSEDCQERNGIIFVRSIIGQMAFFDAAKLEAHKKDIADMLMQLPDEFMFTGEGKGWSFVNTGIRKTDGVLWGEQRDMDWLLMLGRALGYVEWLLPRKMWKVLPGGVPYLVVRDDKINNAA